jgi:hypothetical protein
MDLRAGLAPASAVYDTAASLPMLAESEMALRLAQGIRDQMARHEQTKCVEWLPEHGSHMHSRFQRPLSYSLDDPAMAEG